jgi:small-conductance mechanosensitive channel
MNATSVTTADGKKRPDPTAINLSIGILGVALVVALALGAVVVKPAVPISLPPSQGFGLFAAFYLVAQFVERITEPFTWVLDRYKLTDDSNKSNRTALIHSVAVLVAVIISSVLGLHFLQAVGVGDSTNHLPGWIDSYATALVISGGTKPLHDFISLLQQTKDQATPA